MTIPDRNIYRHRTVKLTANSLLWRYMDFPKYVSFLLNKSLFFSRLSNLNDPYEGVLTRPDYEKMKSDYAKGDESKEAEIRKWMEDERRRYFVNCWHLGEEESAAMWSLYGLRNQSIAVTAAFSNMIDQLPVFVCVSPVVYIDFDSTLHYSVNRLGTDQLVLWKRTSFQHEREVRFFFSNMGLILAGQTASPPILVGASDGSGFYVTVSPEKMITAVYVDPTAPSWFYKLVSDISERNGLRGVVRRSRLWLGPDYA